MVTSQVEYIPAPAFYNDGSRYLTRVDQPVNLVDDQHLAFGADKDVVALLKSGTHSANSPLTDVFIGTPVTPALPVNTFILSNVTASGDLLWAVNKGGHSQGVFWADGSLGNTAVMAAVGASVDTYIGGTKEIDYATGAMAFQQATTISAVGDLTLDSTASLNVTLADDQANALAFASSAVTYYRIDTRKTNSGSTGHAWDIEDATLTSASGAHFGLAAFGSYTINYEGNTTVTTQVRAINFGALTIAADGVGGILTVNRATTLMLQAPIEGANVSLANTYAIRIVNTSGTPTTQTAILIDALSAGGTNIGLSTSNDIDLRSAGEVLNVGASGNDLLAGTITWVSASDTMGTFTFSTYSVTPATRSEFILERSNHNTVGTHGAVDAGDVLGALVFKGSDGDSFEIGSEIRVAPTETWGAGARGTKLEIYTVDNTTTALDLRLTIDHDGHMIATDAMEFTPTTDGNGSIGTAALRWNLVRAVTITSGDFGWEEKRDYYTDLPFRPDDLLVMAVKSVGTERGTLTVPTTFETALERSHQIRDIKGQVEALMARLEVLEVVA